MKPLDGQRRIVAELEGLQAKVNGLRTLMPSVLDRAFMGEL